jgi:hypothetical protein
MVVSNVSRVVDIAIDATGHLLVGLALELVDGGEVIDRNWYYTADEPFKDVDAQIALVNAHLVAMKREPVAD